MHACRSSLFHTIFLILWPFYTILQSVPCNKMFKMLAMQACVIRYIVYFITAFGGDKHGTMRATPIK